MLNLLSYPSKNEKNYASISCNFYVLVDLKYPEILVSFYNFFKNISVVFSIIESPPIFSNSDFYLIVFSI